MLNYQIIQEIDHGTFSVVYKAVHKLTRSLVALKKMKKPIFSSQKLQLRQLKILQSIKNPSVTALKDWFVQDEGVLVFVFDFAPENLLNLYSRLAAKRMRPFSQREVKCIIFQCLLGLTYLHNLQIIHRDIKPQNILFDKQSKHVRLTDFGLSRFLNTSELTQYVSTRWYRAPQMLLNFQYGRPADIFALGCIMLQLLQSKEMFDGQGTFDQLDKQLKFLGKPSFQEWPQFHSLCAKKGFVFPNYQPVSLHEFFPEVSMEGIQVADQMLRVNPRLRGRAKDLIKLNYFQQIYQQIPREVLEYFKKQLKQRDSKSAKIEERVYSSKFIKDSFITTRKHPLGSLENRTVFKSTQLEFNRSLEHNSKFLQKETKAARPIRVSEKNQNIRRTALRNSPLSKRVWQNINSNKGYKF